MDRPSSHSQKVPYARKEGRKSLFSKMKDSMRDMLSPSWLSDLVHNVKKDSPVASDRNSPMSSDQALGMQPAAPGMQDSPHLLSPILPPGPGGMTSSDAQQPGSFKSRGSFLGNGQPRTLEFAELGQGVNPNDPMVSAFQQGNFPPPISEFTSAQLPLARLTEKSDSIMAQEDTMSQRSDGSKSTSGCSSMVPQTEVCRQDIGGDKRKAPEQGHVGSTSPQEQHAAKRQRLHAGAASNQTFTRRLSDTFINKSSMSHRPAFNTTLFGSPFTNESSLLGTSLHESSFYPGKTKFGGRSSFRSQKKAVDLNQSLPGRLSVPVKAFMKAKPRLNPNKEAVTSSTAKRILEALDKMPTPLNDAKKIPMVPRQWTESPSFFSRDRPAARIGPPTQKLNVSSQISISKNRQVSFAPVGQPKPSTSQVQEETVSRPTRQDTVVLNTETAGSGKMRREKSYHRGSASVKTTLEEQDTVILPDLQTNFTLPVSSMPKFSFAAPVSQPKSREPVSKPQLGEPLQMGLKEQVTNSGQSTTESPVKQSLKFTFSSPIIEPVPSNKPASPQKFGVSKPQAFQFSSPISVDKKNEVSMGDSNKPFIATTFNPTASTEGFSFSSPANKLNTDYSFSTAAKPKPKINGPTEPTGGGFAVASELKQGSVMDILGGGSLKKSAMPSTQSVGPLAGSPGTETSKAPPLSALFKQSGWNCDVCLINNRDDVNKCVACQTPKSSGQKSADMTNTTSTTSEPAKTDLFAKFQAPSGTWSCDVCLLLNKPDASKCVACQSQKPASKASSTSEPAKTDLFAKFQKPSGTWSCDVCLIQNKPELTKCAACQSLKPGTASSGSFPLIGSIQPGNWICSKCLIQNKQSDTICGACKAAKSSSKPSETEKSDSLFEKLKPATGTWECETCLVQNMKDAKTCVACQTPKPLKFFKHPPGDWTCDTCLVSNNENAVNCVACNYARPGPPRTQAVPRIVKSYTLSQTPGFSIPSSSESTGVSQSSTGGFKFSPASVAGSTMSGFNVSKLNEDAKKSSETKTPLGGFKFNTETSSTTSSSGFKFGTTASSESDKSGESAGGFKVNAVVPSTDKQTTGFKFGGSDSKSENAEGPIKSAGFQFGKSDSSLASVSSSVSNTQSTVGFTFGQKKDQSALNNSSTAGFSFGQKADQLQTTTSVPGGFTYKPADSLSSVKSSGTESTKTMTNSISAGGFNFSTVTSSTGSISAISSNSIGKFTFTATKATDPNILSGTTKSSEAPASTIGGFSFGQKSAESNTSNQPFSFAQKTASSSPNKRGRDDDTGEPEVKKAAFSFGQTANSNSSSPFQFGANNAATTSSNSSSMFAFGQKPTTSSSTGLFAFGQQNSTPVSSTGSSVFGIQNSTPASSTMPSVFGQQNAPATTTSSISSAFAFGGQKASESSGSTMFGQTNSLATTTAVPSLFQFGQANNTASVAPTFNPAAQSSGQTSVFGSSTQSFNFTTQKTETTTAAPTAGLFKFGASQPAPATTPAFGSSSAFGSGSTPAFGTGSGASGAFSGNAPSTTPAFGSTPPAFGSSNSNSGQSAPAFGETSLKCTEMKSDDGITTSTDSYNTFDKLSNQTCQFKSSSRNIVEVSSEESFFHGCDKYLEDNEEVEIPHEHLQGCCIEKQIIEKNVDLVIVTAEDKTRVIDDNKTEVTVENMVNLTAENWVKVPSGQCTAVKDESHVDVVCQTDALLEQRSEATQTDQQKDIGSCTSKETGSEEVQNESKMRFVSWETPVTVSSFDLGKRSEKKNELSFIEKAGLRSCIACSKSSDKTVMPNTGVANEPLSYGKLFLVPSFKESLNTAVILAPAITKALMTSKLSQRTEMPLGYSAGSSGQTLATVTASGSPVFRFGVTTTASSSPVFRFGVKTTASSSTVFRFGVTTTASSSPVFRFGVTVSSSPVTAISSSQSTAVSSCAERPNLISTRWTDGICVSKDTNRTIDSATRQNCDSMNFPSSSSLTCHFSLPFSSVTSLQSRIGSLPATRGMSPMFSLVSHPATTGMSSVFGLISQPATTGMSSVFGLISQPATTGMSSVFGQVSRPVTKGMSSTFGLVSQPSTTGMLPMFGLVSQPATTEMSSVFGLVSQPVTSGMSSVFGRVSQPATTGMSSVFGLVSQPATTSMSSEFDRESQPATTGMSSVFGLVSQPATTGMSPVFGLVSQPATTGMSSVFGLVSQPATAGMSSVFGLVSQPATAGMSSTFGLVSRPATAGMSSTFGLVSRPATTGMSPVLNLVSQPSGTGMSPVFGLIIPPATTGISLFGLISQPVTSRMVPVFGNINHTSSKGMPTVFGKVSEPASTGMSPVLNTEALSAGSSFTLNNKTGFVLRLPFNPKTFQEQSGSIVSFGGNVRQACSSTSKNKFVFTRRQDEHVDMQSESTCCGYKAGSSRKPGSEGVFSFQSPAVLDDVVMEECCPVSSSTDQSGSEKSVMQVGTSTRRVAFSFSPPQVADDHLFHQKQPSPVNKANKSILKAKTREMVTAFDAATVCGSYEEQEKSERDVGTQAVMKAPSVSTLFGGKKNFGDAEIVQVCNSKSLHWSSGNMDTSSGFTEQENVGSKGSKSSPDIHSGSFSPRISSIVDSTTSSVRFGLSVLEDIKERTPSTKCVNFVPETPVESHSSGVFSFTAKPDCSPLSLPPSKHGNVSCFSTAVPNPLFNNRQSEANALSSASGASHACQNVFVFSAKDSTFSNPYSFFSDREVKNSTSRSENEKSTVSAFSGKSRNKVSPFSSELKTTGSSHSVSSDSGSDISRSSSSTSSSSDSDSSVSSSSSSASSASSADQDGHNIQSGSLPMEDDLGSNNNAEDEWNDVLVDLTGWQNETLDARAIEENCLHTYDRYIIGILLVKLLGVICRGQYAVRIQPEFHQSKTVFVFHEIRWIGLNECQRMLMSSFSSGVFGNPSQPAAPTQSNAVFQFGAKPADTTQAAASTGFSFVPSMNPAGLGPGANFNFSATQGTPSNTFSATGSSTPSDGRIIKKATRRIKR